MGTDSLTVTHPYYTCNMLGHSVVWVMLYDSAGDETNLIHWHCRVQLSGTALGKVARILPYEERAFGRLTRAASGTALKAAGAVILHGDRHLNLPL